MKLGDWLLAGGALALLALSTSANVLLPTPNLRPPIDRRIAIEGIDRGAFAEVRFIAATFPPSTVSPGAFELAPPNGAPARVGFEELRASVPIRSRFGPPTILAVSGDVELPAEPSELRALLARRPIPSVRAEPIVELLGDVRSIESVYRVEEIGGSTIRVTVTEEARDGHGQLVERKTQTIPGWDCEIRAAPPTRPPESGATAGDVNGGPTGSGDPRRAAWPLLGMSGLAFAALLIVRARSAR